MTEPGLWVALHHPPPVGAHLSLSARPRLRSALAGDSAALGSMWPRNSPGSSVSPPMAPAGGQHRILSALEVSCRPRLARRCSCLLKVRVELLEIAHSTPSLSHVREEGWVGSAAPS